MPLGDSIILSEVYPLCPYSYACTDGDQRSHAYWPANRTAVTLRHHSMNVPRSEVINLRTPHVNISELNAINSKGTAMGTSGSELPREGA